MRRLPDEFRFEYLVSGRISGIRPILNIRYPVFNFYPKPGKFAIQHIPIIKCHKHSLQASKTIRKLHTFHRYNLSSTHLADLGLQWPNDFSIIWKSRYQWNNLKVLPFLQCFNFWLFCSFGELEALFFRRISR